MSTTELGLITTQQSAETTTNASAANLDHENSDKKEHCGCNNLKNCIYFVIEIFIFIFVSFLSLLLMFIFACLSFNLSVTTIPIWTLFMFLILQFIVFGLFMICHIHRNEIRKWVIIRSLISIFEYLILLFVMEILISTFVPNLSIFPNAYSYNALTHGNYTEKYKNYLNKSQTFFDCNLDVSMVKVRDVTQSSMVNNYFDDVNFNAAAYVYFDTVHIVSSDHVISDYAFIHELAHIWQFNYGMFYGTDGVNFLFGAMKPPDVNNYDYGDLDEALNEGKDFFDFGIEQQASIIEDYYYYIQKDSWWINNSSLQYYATQYVLTPCL